MSKADLDQVISCITLPKFWAVRTMEKGDGFLIQIVFPAEDAITGKEEMQFCRKWYVSSYATASEVVRTVYKAGVAALEHEFQEQFKVDGITVYHPHADLLDTFEPNLDKRKPIAPENRTIKEGSYPTR